MQPLAAEGVRVDIEALLGFRHLTRNLGRSRSLAPVGPPGGLVARARGRGLDTADIRPYAPGDDMRHLDRNVSARLAAPHIRTFHDERDRSVLLVADFRPAMHWGARRAFWSVAAAEALALIGWKTVDRGGRVGLLAFGACEPVLTPARGREAGMIAVIGAMAAAHQAELEAARLAPNADSPLLDDMLDMAARVAPAGGGVYLATGLDAPGDRFDLTAQALTRRSELNVLLISGGLGRTPPPGAYPCIGPDGEARWTRIGRAAAPEAEDPRNRRLTDLGANVQRLDAEDGAERTAGVLDMFDAGQR